jgi:hypothetical protein
MPAAIVSLESLRGRAVPITTDERRGRLERARALMTSARMDAVVLGGGASLTYFTGAGWGNSESRWFPHSRKSGSVNSSRRGRSALSTCGSGRRTKIRGHGWRKG